MPTMDEPITMYSTTWCGYCRRLKRQLAEVGIEVQEVDIDEQPHLGAQIEAKTGGFRVVPTVQINGALLVNPTVFEVQAALEA